MRATVTITPTPRHGADLVVPAQALVRAIASGRDTRQYVEALDAQAIAKGTSRRRANNAKQIEAHLQEAVAAVLDQAVIHGWPMVWWHVPNGADMKPKERARLHRAGLLRGVQDVEICLPGGVTWRIEMKTMDGRLDDDQRILRDKLTRLGHRVEVVRSVAELVPLLREIRRRYIPTPLTARARRAIVPAGGQT